jgi:hypothetical protein
MEYGSIFRNTDAESWPVREKPGTISQPDFKTGLFPYREPNKAQEVEDVALGTRVFYRRINCCLARIHRHLGCSRGDRENFVLSLLDSLPGHVNGALAAQVVSETNI